MMTPERETERIQQGPAVSDGSRTVQRLRERFPDAVREVTLFRDEVTVVVAREALLDACRFLRDDPEEGYAFLVDICGVDRLGRRPRFDVVYHLLSIPHARRLRLKVQVDEGEPVDSVTPIWTGANWFEREAYDLVGIPFRGHPDLQRILMPEDWEGHPLRRDYPMESVPKFWEQR